MTRPWWQPGPTPPPARGLVRLLSPVEAPAAPATLLRFPDPIRVGSASTRRAAPVGLTSSRRCEPSGPAPGAATSGIGMARSWRARSIDLRRLMVPTAPATGHTGATGTDEESEGAAELLSRERAWLEALMRRLMVVLQPPPEILLRASGPLTWPHELYPYQVSGVHALVQSPQLLLGDEMGLGKTIQAIAALRILLFRRQVERALVVAPASLLEQWRMELARWAPELRVMRIHGPSQERRWQWRYRAHVSLTSYETLRADFTGTFQCGPCQETWGVVVLDEAQKIKNRESDAARACRGLPRLRAWALTGTPMENRLEDLASILEFVTGSLLPTDSLALRTALGQYQLRRKKDQVLLDLPPKIVADITLEMSGAQRRAYERAEKEGIATLREMGEVRVENVLALITRLKQICNFGPGGQSVKMEDLCSRLEELSSEGYKALVFTQYASDDSGARRIASGLARFSPLVLTGDLSLLQRADVVRRFETGDHVVLVLSLRAGGLGLNLQCASYVFHFDRWWNPAVERQAEDRTHRIGQTRPVNVYRYVIAGTIEQRIQELLKNKIDLFTRVVDDISIDAAKLISKEELLEVLGMEGGTQG